MYLLVIVIH